MAEYHSLPSIDLEPSPGGGGAALAVPADVVLAVVPAVSLVDQANRTAIVAYLDSAKADADRWTLTDALLGEDYFQACGLTDRALAAWCRTRLGIPTTELVCPSALCCGRGVFQCHPEGDLERCHVCRGSGVVPGHSVAAIADEGVRHAA